jgi:hypothetical protein
MGIMTTPEPPAFPFTQEEIERIIKQPNTQIEVACFDFWKRLQFLWEFHSLCRRCLHFVPKSASQASTVDKYVLLAAYEIHDDFPRLNANLVLRLWSQYETFIVNLLASLISLETFRWDWKSVLGKCHKRVSESKTSLDYPDYREIVKRARQSCYGREPREEKTGWQVEKLLLELGFSCEPKVTEETLGTLVELYAVRNKLMHAGGADYEAFREMRRNSTDPGDVTTDTEPLQWPGIPIIISTEAIGNYWYHVVEYVKNIRVRALYLFNVEVSPDRLADYIQQLPLRAIG